jgi:hypothetical protein
MEDWRILGNFLGSPWFYYGENIILRFGFDRYGIRMLENFDDLCRIRGIY